MNNPQNLSEVSPGYFFSDSIDFRSYPAFVGRCVVSYAVSVESGSDCMLLRSSAAPLYIPLFSVNLQATFRMLTK